MHVGTHIRIEHSICDNQQAQCTISNGKNNEKVKVILFRAAAVSAICTRMMMMFDKVYIYVHTKLQFSTCAA
jgi:hypothetical protein